MSIKWIGALMIIFSCGGFGFYHAANYRREERLLRELLSALDYIECELQYHLTPLPQLCRQVASQSRGQVSLLFQELASELESQISPDVSSCMHAALLKCRSLPQRMQTLLKEFGKTLGRFDMQGQLRGLEGTRQQCREMLDALAQNREVRLRSYQTLGLCAGAALAILFV